MITKIAACLLAVSLLASCTTTTTTQRTTLREMNNARLAAADTTTIDPNDPPSPAEGPEDVPAEGPSDPIRNPALVPSPLLRMSAAGSP
jgi:hypothetical protein